MALDLKDDVRYLKGVGEKRAALYAKLGVRTLRDLLYHLPRSYIDLSKPYDIASAPLGEPVAVRALVLTRSPAQMIRRGMTLYKVTATDNHAMLTITFFNAKYTAEALQPGKEYIFYGRVTGNMLRREMASPSVHPVEGAPPLLPVYPLTAGLTSKAVMRDIHNALPLAAQSPDPIPVHLRQAHDLCPLGEALTAIHLPTTMDDVNLARRRLAFEELFVLSLGFGLMKGGRAAVKTQPMQPVSLEPFYDALPFTPTDAQRRAIQQSVKDLLGTRPMNRLIEGDVGSGKTLVAAACAYYVAKNGGQAALMAPTEILAEQHYQTLAPLLMPLGIRSALLTGGLTPAAKKAVQAAVAAGEVDLCIGTHALVSKNVTFANLRLAITDEQHRFGVAQRLALREKGEDTHMLVLSATPIPRTLALIIYGDLDLSIIDQLPPGRIPVETYRIDSAKRDRAFGFIRKHLDQGLQAYIVCPIIEQSEMTTHLTPATDYAQSLADGPFKGYRVGLLHGRMTAAQKEETMRHFKDGQLQLLVSTTVIEVGVDVPNAVIILIENAERFGLSQLHQLRGRVGRGNHRSYCILVSDATGPDSTARLDVLRSTNDGFAVAEQDLKLRGPGDFFGTRQHGLPTMKIADLAADLPLLSYAQEAAAEQLAADPTLSGCPALKQVVLQLIERVGDRPN